MGHFADLLLLFSKCPRAFAVAETLSVECEVRATMKQQKTWKKNRVRGRRSVWHVPKRVTKKKRIKNMTTFTSIRRA